MSFDMCMREWMCAGENERMNVQYEADSAKMLSQYACVSNTAWVRLMNQIACRGSYSFSPNIRNMLESIAAAAH